MPRLSKKQSQILMCIRRHIAETGYPPTLREIAMKTNIALTTVYQNIGLLQAKGHLERNEGTARGLRLVGPPSRALSNESVLTISIDLLGAHETILANARAGVRQLQSLIASLE